LAIDFVPTGDVEALGQHLADLLGDKDRQVEMALQNVSAAMRMSMPGIIQDYVRTFSIRQGIEEMRSISKLRKLPRWFPLRGRLVRRETRKVLRRMSEETTASPVPSAVIAQSGAEVVYLTHSSSTDSKTGTDGM